MGVLPYCFDEIKNNFIQIIMVLIQLTLSLSEYCDQKNRNLSITSIYYSIIDKGSFKISSKIQLKI